MRLRNIILAASVPLLMLLAAINGALLYFQSKAEMLRGIDNRALAAAVTAAEFLSSIDHASPVDVASERRDALAAAARHVDGLDGYYLVDGAGNIVALAPATRRWVPGRDQPPSGRRVTPLMRDPDGRRYVAAQARLASGGFVAARIDAEPMFQQLDALLRRILVGVAFAAMIGIVAGWYVAGRIRKELAASRAIIDAIDGGLPLPDTDALRIAEAADLAAALRLLDAGRNAAISALDQSLAREDEGRDEASAFASLRRAHVPPIDTALAGAAIAVRFCGNVTPGSFAALCHSGDKAALVIGECSATTPIDALAMALSARRFLENGWWDMPERPICDIVRSAFNVTRMAHMTWSAETRPGKLVLTCLADDATASAAETYIAATPDGSPRAALDRIAALLKPDGVFALIGPAD
ncbi:MAG: hypothetical protein U0S50_12965 [Sphingopyxis sp.]|uniref:hypothetical protein n=1 Tax=Sphingopyxis sp. TaxID=1908224 RepID=UPI002AB96781|nr:hypothetical protein [Sphingopyxis sp.]MDZ3832706.1 hypothetical protein [Sphingopyxis sp.]